MSLKILYNMLTRVILVMVMSKLSMNEENYIDSSYCYDIQNCSSDARLNVLQQVCSCDELCGLFDDCCPGFDSVKPLQLKNDQFSCERVNGIGEIMLITKCPAYWTDDQTKALCENSMKNRDMMSKVIVSDKSIERLVFKNMHCAMCNNVYDYQFWKVAINCQNDSINQSDTRSTNTSSQELSYCDVSFDQPGEQYRDCSLVPNKIIDHCPQFNDSDVIEKCENGTTLLVFAMDLSQFKNKYCAKCNGYNELELRCEMFIFIVQMPDIPGANLYSFRIVVDFNKKFTVKEDFAANKKKLQLVFPECKKDQIFDPITKHCRDMICPVGTQPFEGKCLLVRQIGLDVLNSSSTVQCAFSKVKSHEVEYLNETNQVLFRKKLYNETEYIRNGSDIFLCINTSVPSHYGRSLQASDELEGYLSLIGLIISIISLSITIIIYIIFSELLNIPGKNLVSLCVSLLLAQLLFLLSPKVSHYVIACQIFAVLMHYFFLAAFSWMNVIAFDLLMTFSNTFGVGHRTRSSKKKFITYSIYSWCVPLIVVLSAVIVDYSIESDIIKEFKPLYGQVGCWISSKYALLLFFVGPLALLKLFDFIAFGIIVYHITKAKKQGAMARNENNSCTFFIHVKLSLVMGLTWVFAFIANFGGTSILWYLFIILNTLQGLFIAFSFVCTRKVFRLIKSRYSLVTSMKSSHSHSTENTTL
ncbi:synapse assembly [Mactra antiquata]